LFRAGLASLLADAGHEIVGLANDAPSLVTAVAEAEPDLAVIDVRMPPDHTDDGARAARRLRILNPELGIVLLSQHVKTRHSVELVATGRSATCSRTGCSRSTSSWRRWTGSRPAGRRSTRRWSAG
jgi:DNA-binding NarL/FixJ family response regulator